jgi:arogenate dehydrogenase (NADP+)
MQHKLSKDKQLTIGIVGFGTFGQFLAKRFVQAGHR